MQRFHDEFEKLFYSLRQVHENEIRLLRRTRQLNDDIETNVGSVSAVLEMTQEEELANVQTHNVKRSHLKSE